MHPGFRVGDRVILTQGHRHPPYRAGAIGTVIAVLPLSGNLGPRLYQVRLDGDDAILLPSFYAEELEATP
jgi:hypothetical protein